MTFLKYIIIFFIFSILGWIYEYAVWNKSSPDGLSKAIFHTNIPFRPLYGFAGILLLCIYSNFTKDSLFTKVVMAAITINILECIAGLCSYKYHGYQTWHYNSNLCYGYISLPTALFWTFMSFIFFVLLESLDFPNKKRKDIF